jgi:tetratricopeptide (TPR) repeat protein
MRVAYGLILALSVLFLAHGSPQEGKVDTETLQAIDAAQRSLRTAPDSETNRITLASLYLKAGQNRSAVETLRTYLQSHPDAPKTLRLLAVAYLREEDYPAAKDAAQRGLLGQQDSAGSETLAMAELGLHENDAAERHFHEALQLDANSVEANLQLGLFYAKQHKNLGEAIRLLEKARALKPDLAGTYAALGSALLESGDARGATASLETAVKLAPDSAQSYYLLGSAYGQLHQEDKAAAALAAFQSRQKTDAGQRAREMRSRADYEAGVNLLSNTDQLDKAYDSLAKAVSELPTFAPGYYRMAQVSYLKGDIQKALSSIREALRLNPLEPEYYYVLARCLEDTDARAALEAIEKAISFRPGVPDFEDLLRELKSKVAPKDPARFNERQPVR